MKVTTFPSYDIDKEMSISAKMWRHARNAIGAANPQNPQAPLTLVGNDGNRIASAIQVAKAFEASAESGKPFMQRVTGCSLELEDSAAGFLDECINNYRGVWIAAVNQPEFQECLDWFRANTKTFTPDEWKKNIEKGAPSATSD